MMPNEKVEIGFDVSGSPEAPFVTLNDPIKGILGSTEYVLGGTIYYDVTEHVFSIGIGRGKTRQLDRYKSGQATVSFNNESRIFDPLYSASPYAGQIIPRRPVRISVNSEVQFQGWIDDWDLSYSLQGKSTASIICSDGLSLLANQILTAGTRTSQLSGARLEAVLSDPQVNWPLDERRIDAGETVLQADEVLENVNALSYLELIATTEFGSFFIDKSGNARYKDRYGIESGDEAILLSDDGTGIPYSDMLVIYGSELLYNNVVLSQLEGSTVAIDDPASQAQFGIFNLTQLGLLMNETEDLVNLAIYLASKYSTPEYRFESVTMQLHDLETVDQEKLLSLELGDTLTVKFTPNNVGDPIERNVEIIRIAHSANPQTHNITFGLGALERPFWRLSDPVFGRLSAGNSLAF